jgi:serine phosphatase RsbU (regulator of sigma subunit)
VEGVVGGDFIGSISLADGDLAIVVGDVTGHGLDAGFDAMRLKDLLFADLNRNRSPVTALWAANAHLLGRDDVLATVFVGIVGTRTLRYASAGHLPGIVVDAGAHRLLPSTGILLGAEQELDVHERTLDLDAHAAVIVYTDGLTEAHGPLGGLDASDIAAIVRAGDFTRLRDVVHERVPLPLRDYIAGRLIRTGTPATDH